ncbi:10417_t:CDS:2 [Acaulospora colombiana]|uniref:10417_t:CDS:1 n=1 Tax=Acaulospora colombiana TaxID=27376 RepID=A0ACA9NBV0_9GLOM|nr:10417_t:CDS:2 [Acaulospora colombiana]
MSLGLDAIFQIHEPTCTRYQLSSVVNTRASVKPSFRICTVYKTAGLNEAHFSHQHLPSSPRFSPSQVQQETTWKYAATEVEKTNSVMSEDEEDGEEGDSEMLTSGSPSAGDSDSASTAETESACDNAANSGPRSKGSSDGIKHEVNILGHEKANDDVSSVSWKEDFGGIVGEEGDNLVEQEAVITPDQLSEWETTGGRADVIAAFEGKMVLDAPLKSVLEWAAPIVWKMFLRQAPLCSAAKQNPTQHAHNLPQNTPCPSFLPALLEKSMPSGMTASIAVTYALLYMYRIKFCFHCNGSTLSADPKSNTNTVASSNSNTITNNAPLVPPDSMDAMRQKSQKSFEKPTMLEPGLQFYTKRLKLCRFDGSQSHLEHYVGWYAVTEQLVEFGADFHHTFGCLFLDDHVGYMVTVRFPIRFGGLNVGR